MDINQQDAASGEFVPRDRIVDQEWHNPCTIFHVKGMIINSKGGE
jgi:hypothetical protein